MSHNRATPTLHDVAEAAGVSTATVSRCLNFPDVVSPGTRERVSKAVADLGYSPNFGAKVMAAKRTNTIGAIIPTMDNAIFARGLQAFQEELRQHGYTMLVASTSYQPDIEEEQIKALVARGADALLLIGHARTPQVYDFLATQDVPALVTWAFDPSAARPSVGFNNKAAMHALAREVLGEGHTRLAFITAPAEHNDRASERLAGIQQAMRDSGLDPVMLNKIEAHYSIDDGSACFEELMKGVSPPTAILCGNDVLAVGALRAAQDMRIKVPEDISIVGFDDIELAQIAYPALSTVHVPHTEMGRQAAGALVALLRDGTPIAPVELPTKLVLRDTLGPAPKP